MLARQEQNSMEKKQFNLEVKEIKDRVNESINTEERNKFLLESETELAVIFDEALHLLGERSYDFMIVKMIVEFKDYQSADYSYDEALIATIWSAVKYKTSIRVGDVEKVIDKIMDFDPSRRVAYLEFRNNHRVWMAAGYLIGTAFAFIGLQFCVSLITHDNFLRWYIPAAIVLAWWYIMYLTGFLKKKNF